jgi:hypothetical protein
VNLKYIIILMISYHKLCQSHASRRVVCMYVCVQTGPGVCFCTGGIHDEHTNLIHANDHICLGLNLRHRHTAVIRLHHKTSQSK